MNPERPMRQPLDESEINAELGRIIVEAEPDEDVWPIEIEVETWPGGRTVERFYEDGSWESEDFLS